jgi:hypothetical protein
MAPSLTTLPYELKEQIFDLLLARETFPLVAIHLDYAEKHQLSFAEILTLGLVNKTLHRDATSFLNQKISRHGLHLFLRGGGRPFRKSSLGSYSEQRVWGACTNVASPWHRPRAPVGEKLPPEFRPRRRRGAIDAGDARRLPRIYSHRVTHLHVDIIEFASIVAPLDPPWTDFPSLESMVLYWNEVSVAYNHSSSPPQPPSEPEPPKILQQWFVRGIIWDRYEKWILELLLTRPADLRVFFKRRYNYYDRWGEYQHTKEFTLEVKEPEILSEVELIGTKIVTGRAPW